MNNIQDDSSVYEQYCCYKDKSVRELINFFNDKTKIEASIDVTVNEKKEPSDDDSLVEKTGQKCAFCVRTYKCKCCVLLVSVKYGDKVCKFYIIVKSSRKSGMNVRKILESVDYIHYYLNHICNTGTENVCKKNMDSNADTNILCQAIKKKNVIQADKKVKRPDKTAQKLLFFEKKHVKIDTARIPTKWMGSDFVDYDALNRPDKLKLAIYCTYKLKNITAKRKTITESFNLLRLFISCKTTHNKKKQVNPEIFNLIKHLKIHGQKEFGIFRVSGRFSSVKNAIERIRNGKSINLPCYSTRDLVSLLKYLIRQDLDGVCTQSITKILLDVFTCDVKTINECLPYIPFIMYGERRKLMLSIFQLFENIAQCEFHNQMNWHKLVICTAPTFFSTKIPMSLKTVQVQIKALNFMRKLSFKEVPKCLLDDAINYTKKSSKY